MKNPRIVIIYYSGDDYGLKTETHYTGTKLSSEKDFKKWYNHLFKDFHRDRENVEIADMLALYETEMGETIELADFWGMEYMKYCPVITYPFNM